MARQRAREAPELKCHLHVNESHTQRPLFEKLMISRKQDRDIYTLYWKKGKIGSAFHCFLFGNICNVYRHPLSSPTHCLV